MVLKIFVPILTLGISALIYTIFTRNQTNVLSPLAETTQAIEKPTIEKPTNTPTFTPSPTLTPTPTIISPTPTNTQTPIPVIAPSDLEEIFAKFSNEYNIDKELLKRIAKCESGLNANASNLGYAGLYQFSERLWDSTRSLMGLSTEPNLRYNAEEAIKTAAFMISQGHLGIWPNCN